jgi:hypothetical protein
MYPAYPRYRITYTPTPMADTMWDPGSDIGLAPRWRRGSVVRVAASVFLNNREFSLLKTARSLVANLGRASCVNFYGLILPPARSI